MGKVNKTPLPIKPFQPLIAASAFKVGMAEKFHLLFLCTNQSVFRSYFDSCLPVSPDDAQYVIA